MKMLIIIILCIIAAAIGISAIIDSRKKTSSEIEQGDSSVSEIKKERMDNVLSDGSDALREMAKLYHDINDLSIREKINEIMLITDKIIQEAEKDPSELTQIRRFFSYYVPTTIKLLKTYEGLNAVGIDGENIVASKKNISEMLDTAIEAYKKRLDSLFENQALDIETDIDVMNQMLEREGLVSSGNGF